MRYDAFLSRKERDEALSLVEEHAQEVWRAQYKLRADAWFDALDVGALFIGEDLRIAIEPQIGQPHHGNAWSAMFRSAIAEWMREQRCERAGTRQMTKTSSHARASLQYRKVFA